MREAPAHFLYFLYGWSGSYRLNKQPLLDVVEQTGCRVAIAFIYLSDRVADSEVIAARMRTALQRIGETLTAPEGRGEAGGPKE